HSVVVQTSHHSKPLPYSARSTHFPYATLFRSMSRACVALQSGGLGSSQLATDGGGRLLRWWEVARHIPRREKASHPQRSHAKSREASHMAQDNIANLHTQRDVVNTHGRGSDPSVRSLYQMSSRLLLPAPSTFISGVLKSPS